MARRKKRDYYDVLEVERTADDAELKRAYRELARKHHPDINQGDSDAEDRFKEANEAYAVLSNPKARARYDRYGFSAVGNVSQDSQESGLSSVVDAVDDMLGDLIGDAWRKRRQRKRGRDLRYTLEISFEESVFGCQKTIQVPRKRYKAGDAGAGSEARPDGTKSGGEKSGGKKSSRARSFTVNIPPGTKEGAVKLIKGEGEPGIAGAPPGDLNVIVRIQDHPLYHREGYDIWCEVPITFAQAALGGIIDVPTVDAQVRMRIPEGTQSGRVLRLRGKGIPKSASKSALRGDQLVKIMVETPTGLTPRQRELLEKFADETGESVAHPQKKSFRDTVAGLFED